MATKKTKRKKADSCWDGYSNYWGGQHHYKKGKNGDRVRDCKSDEEIAAMSSKKSAPTAMVEGDVPKKDTSRNPENPKKPKSTIEDIKNAHKIKKKPKKKD